MSSSSCSFCRPFHLSEPVLHFACPSCGRRMLMIHGPGFDHVYHCPEHCATLVPNAAQLARATAANN